MENIEVLDQTTTGLTEFGQPYSREFLEPLSVSQLKKLAQDTASVLKHRSSWIATTNKAALVEYLVTGQLPASGQLPTNGQQTPSIAQYDLASVIAQAIQPLMNTKAEIDEEKINNLIDHKLGGFLETAEEMIKGHLANISTIVVQRLDGTKIDVGVQHKQFPELLKYLEQRCNVYLVGPAASGKTFVAHAIADSLGLPYYADSVCAQTSESKIFGYMNALGFYVVSKFRKAYEFGGVYLLDELDNGNANTIAALNQATANGECGFPDGMVKKHADFICVAAGNTFGNGADRQYVGRNQLDGATLDRFVFLDWEYDEQLELSICPNKCWTTYVQSVRHAVAKLKIRHIVSVRVSMIGGTMINAGVPRDRIEKTVLWKGLAPEEIAKVVANLE